MKTWWLNLSLREKQTVALGSLIILLFLIYEILWSPLANLNQTLRNRIVQNEQTLLIMQNADQLIKHLQETSKQSHALSTQSASAILQSELNKSPYGTQIIQLRTVENNAVQVQLRKVNFDWLPVFLNQLWNQYGLIVVQLTATPIGAPGEVTVDMTLTSNAGH